MTGCEAGTATSHKHGPAGTRQPWQVHVQNDSETEVLDIRVQSASQEEGFGSDCVTHMNANSSLSSW